MKDQILIKVISHADCEDIWAWRNDPITRAMSIHSSAISWSAHKKWFQEFMNSTYDLGYIGYINDQKIGFCRFKFDLKNNAEISINLNPEMRGKGLSSRFLEKSIQEMRKTHNFDLIALIKKPNISSIKCFERVGFFLFEEDQHCFYYKKTAVS